MAENRNAALLREVGGLCYVLTRRRIKNLNLRVRRDGSVALSVPLRTPLREADAFVLAQRAWIERAVQRQRSLAALPLPERQAALAHFTALSAAVFPLFAQALGEAMPSIQVRNMRSRWGVCCPAKRRITYALALAAMPEAAQYYVVVHEFCHFLVPNHSPAFWAEVEKRLPDWKARRALLRADVSKLGR